MRLIVDTNQADAIRRTFRKIPAKARPTLVIPHLVWIELQNGFAAEKRRYALTKFPLLFGADETTIYDCLATFTEDRIRRFDPVYPSGSVGHQRESSTFLHPEHRQLKIGAEIIDEHRKRRLRLHNDVIPRLRKRFREQHTAAKSRGEGLDFVKCLNDVTNTLFLNKESPIRQEIVRRVSTDGDNNPRPIAAKSVTSLFDAIWDNPIFRRWLRLEAVVINGYLEAWEDTSLNRPLKLANDDLPDISLALYARDGDTILTNDNVKHSIRHIDEDNMLNVTTWDEWLAGHDALKTSRYNGHEDTI